MEKYNRIQFCRVCKSSHLTSIFDLGQQALTGVFPRYKTEYIPEMPVELVRCEYCGLVQLSCTYELSEMYGMNYGYRSGLNKSMVNHLGSVVKRIQEIQPLSSGDLVLDIGSNDSTLLQLYGRQDLELVGIDPTGVKFSKFYPDYVRLIPEFFGSPEVTAKLNNKKAKVITSIACFYDLEDPVRFAQEVANTLGLHGIWVLEQAYMPRMLETNGIDCACHEHLEFYALTQIQSILNRVGLSVLDVTFDGTNGGSFCVYAGHIFSSWHQPNYKKVEEILEIEKPLFESNFAFLSFKKRVERRMKQLKSFLKDCKKNNKVVHGLAASTKGNVILQYAGIDETLLPYIADVNEDKFGCFTPGTKIPIISEQTSLSLKPDYYLVLAYHFRDTMIERFSEFRSNGGKLVFPLPDLEIV